MLGEHKHHWIIDEPEGSTSWGECTICGAVRNFKNFLPEFDFLTRQELKEVRLGVE
jgi:hypothetical protein